MSRLWSQEWPESSLGLTQGLLQPFLKYSGFHSPNSLVYPEYDIEFILSPVLFNISTFSFHPQSNDSWKKFNIGCTDEFGGGREELGEKVKAKLRKSLFRGPDGSYFRKVATSLSTHIFFFIFFLLMSVYSCLRKRLIGLIYNSLSSSENTRFLSFHPLSGVGLKSLNLSPESSVRNLLLIDWGIAIPFF